MNVGDISELTRGFRDLIRLYFELSRAFFCSLLLHWLISLAGTALGSFPSLPATSPDRISVSIKNSHGGKSQSEPQYNDQGLLPRAKMVALQDDDASIYAKQMVFDGGRLDAPLAVINAPILEPPYGFADDVSGSVTLDMLIDRSGVVVHVWSESEDFDQNTMDYLLGALKAARFSVPTVKNRPVYVVFRIVIEIERSGMQ